MHDHEGFTELAKKAHQRVRENPQAQEMGRWGTWILTAVKQEIGELPTYNHRTGVFSGWEKLAADYIRPRYAVAWHYGQTDLAFGVAVVLMALLIATVIDIDLIIHQQLAIAPSHRVVPGADHGIAIHERLMVPRPGFSVARPGQLSPTDTVNIRIVRILDDVIA